MANAKIDQNSKPTLIGVSSTDGVTPTLVYVNPTTNRILADLSGGVTSGSAAPNTTPSAVGLMYVDTVNKKVYVSTGTSSSSDWTILN